MPGASSAVVPWILTDWEMGAVVPILPVRTLTRSGLLRLTSCWAAGLGFKPDCFDYKAHPHSPPAYAQFGSLPPSPATLYTLMPPMSHFSLDPEPLFVCIQSTHHHFRSLLCSPPFVPCFVASTYKSAWHPVGTQLIFAE